MTHLAFATIAASALVLPLSLAAQEGKMPMPSSPPMVGSATVEPVSPPVPPTTPDASALPETLAPPAVPVATPPPPPAEIPAPPPPLAPPAVAPPPMATTPQLAPPPPLAGNPPLCSARVRDNCMNPREAPRGYHPGHA